MIHTGDALTVLRTLPDECVHCCITSPPYWGLRDYGMAGQLGLEKSPQEYVERMVDVFREVRRVLRKDATLWLNMGDGYAQQGGPGWQGKNGQRADRRFTGSRNTVAMREVSLHVPVGLKPKDMIGMPWRLAFALQADGWYLRSDIIWSKPNPMPESVTDRPTKAHEYIFLMSRSARYYYDAEAIEEPGSESTKMPDGWNTSLGAHGSFHPSGREKGRKTDKRRGHSRRHTGFNDRWDQMEREAQCSGKRNKRDVWTVATQPCPEAHFATFPERLIGPCVLAGCREGGIVLDPFLGSGTTALVALKANRQFLGIELNPKYVEMAERRIAAEKLQGKLL